MTDLRVPARTTLAGAVWPERVSARARALRAVVLAILGTAILTLSARTQVPFTPVPMTLQDFAVLTLGAIYGARLGAATVALYLVEGALGLPVFAGTPEHGIGLAYMMGPTGGFLVGFFLAAVCVGFFAERGADHSFPKLLAAMATGHVLLFAAGFVWLAVLLGRSKAYSLGVEPFLLKTVVETVLAALLVPAVWQAVSPRRR